MSSYPLQDGLIYDRSVALSVIRLHREIASASGRAAAVQKRGL